MTEKRVTRRFGKSFDYVTTKAQSVQPQFITDQASFVALDPSLTLEFANTLGADTDTALKDSSGEEHKAAIRRSTNSIAQLLKSALQAYKKLQYYVHAAFGENKSIDSTFGRQRYEKARHSEKEMISLLNQAVEAAKLEQFNAGLIEKGMPADLLTSMEQLAADLLATDNEQEMLKKKELLVTDNRVKLYNAIWDKLTKIDKAAKVVFADDPTRLAIYQLYDTPSGGEAEMLGEEESAAG